MGLSQSPSAQVPLRRTGWTVARRDISGLEAVDLEKIISNDSQWKFGLV